MHRLLGGIGSGIDRLSGIEQPFQIAFQSKLQFAQGLIARKGDLRSVLGLSIDESIEH
jgi:hypothetical protein